MNSDKKIWDDFRKGKDQALSDIYNKYIQLLFRFGKKFSDDDELLKDTIQDLFFDLIRTRKKLGVTDNICFYLMASFRRKLVRNLSHINKSIDQYSGNEKEPEVNIVYSIETELIEKEELTEREKAVKEALAELSPGQREILFYRFTCNFDYGQICEIMKIKYDSARKQVSRALKSMKKALADSEIILFFLKFSKKY